ncbi:MAG TPA: extracellular solute-binding protein, partial [Gemmatimonadales bacterium]
MRSIIALVTTALLAFAQTAWAATELTFYYPIAVGGPLTKVIDGLAAEFEKQNPGIKVHPIYAGNYDDARIKALAAIKAGQPAQLSVLFSIDIYELLEQDVIVAWDDVATSADDKAWLKSFYPALMMNGTYKGKVYGIPFQRSTIVL